jgi:hypothetical protein
MKNQNNDSRYNVWICEAKMSDGIWYPMPNWGASDRRETAKLNSFNEFLKNNINWAMNKEKTKPSNKIRFRKYIKKEI